MKIKICGLFDPENIAAVVSAQPDFVGFIFYPKSKRYVGTNFDPNLIVNLPKSTQKVGVFVNENRDQIQRIHSKFSLDYIQLHGDETPEDCAFFKSKGMRIIKAFGVGVGFDFSSITDYLPYCDYFLFDTATPNYGGSGQSFPWEILNDYPFDTPLILSGGLGVTEVKTLLKSGIPKVEILDCNSQLENENYHKNLDLVAEVIALRRNKNVGIQPDAAGYYGEFGGAFIPEMLYPNVKELQEHYLSHLHDSEFQREFQDLLKSYVGRPTPLFYSKNLSALYGGKIYLKREDLNHTGAHKINNAIGQVLLAKRLQKKRIIAETGAGQHGVATATACALLGMECTIYMGEIDIQRQQPNVERMRLMGAKIVPATSGSRTLKDATNEAIRAWINNPVDTYYVIGSAVGPHPYPDMVARFQSVISEEIQVQLKQETGLSAPDYIIACLGGGSNAIGAFYHFIGNPNTQLIAVEAGGLGVDSGKTAATIALGKKGIIHGSKTFLIQTDDGQIVEPHSISAGLDYPGIGPVHAHLSATGLAKVVSVTDEEAVAAALQLARLDGILPALESAHALAYLPKMQIQPDEIVIVNLSGRGDKDLATLIPFLHHEK